MAKKQIIFVVSVLLYMFNANPVLANLTIKAEIGDNVLMAGDNTLIQLKVDGAKKDVKIELPQLDGLLIQQEGPPMSSSQTTIINGKVTQFSGLVYRIRIQSIKVGNYQIPPIKIQHSGKLYQTQAFTFRVMDPGTTTKMRLEVVPSKTEIYPTESLKLTLNWYLQESVSEYDFSFPLLKQKDPLRLKLSDEMSRNNATTLTLSQYDVPFNKSEQKYQGESYTVYSTQFVVFPTEVGKLTISPASVKAFVKIGTEIKTDFFGRRIRVPKHRKIFSASKPVSIIVKSLPENNKPRFFTGAIGRFNIALTANAKRVKVGDPVEIKIKVTGDGRLDLIEAPLLSEMEAFAENFVIVDSLQPGDVQKTSIEFKQIIRPKTDKITEIPPVHFSFFNTQTETYETITSNRFPIKVLPAKKVQKTDIINYNKGQKKESFEMSFSGQGIQANYLFEDALEDQSEEVYWFVLLLLPPMLYVGLLWFSHQRQKLNDNQALLRSKTAKSIKNKRLKEAKKVINADQQKFLQALSISISGYISDRLDLGNAELTVVEIEQLISEHQLEPSVFNDVIALLEEMERYRFTGIEITDSERLQLFEKTSGTLNRMQKVI